MDIVFFSLSIIACAVILYILAMLWFSNTHSRQLKSFIAFGLSVGLWIFFTAISAVADGQHFVFMYSVHSVTACVFPYIFVWYGLNLWESKLTRCKPFVFVLFLIPTLDAILLATSPFHHLMIMSHENYPEILLGPLFPVHMLFAYAAFLASLILIFVNIWRNTKRTPVMIATAATTILPFAVNIALALNLLDRHYDFTAISFFLTFTVYFLTTYHVGPFSFKSIALTNIFTSLSDIIVITNSKGVIVDSNDAFAGTFPNFPLVLSKTTMEDFTGWLSGRAVSCSPEIGRAHV